MAAKPFAAAIIDGSPYNSYGKPERVEIRRSKAARGRAVCMPFDSLTVAREVLAPVLTRPPLPSRKLTPPRGLGVYACDLHVERDGDGFKLVMVSHEIDRNGEKDTFVETVSCHASLGEAVAAMEAA